MKCQELVTYILILIVASSCNLNLNAPDDGNGGPDPDTTTIFQNVSSSSLPPGLSGTTQKAKTGDIDGDKDLDLILAIPSQPNKVLINDGSGNFTDESDSRLPDQTSDTRDVAVTDLDNDGDLDLFFVGNQTPTNELYINNGRGNFSDLSNRIPVSGNSISVEALDIDGSGSTDIMIGNSGQNIMLMNGGNAFFTNQTSERLPTKLDATQDIAFGDITGDNRRDIVVANKDVNSILINTGNGFFINQTETRLPIIPSTEETRDVDLADVDGDGDLDIYFGNSGFQTGSNPQDRLLINNGQGFFSDRTTDRLPAVTTNTFDAEFADLDQDGDFDLVVGNYNGGIRVLVNNGNGFFTDVSGNWIPEEFFPNITDLEVADFNADNRFDIFISVRNGNDRLLIQKDQ